MGLVQPSPGKNRGNTKVQDQRLKVRDMRTMPFFWIQRALLDEIKPSYQGLIAYNALAYYSAESKCRSIGIKQLAAKVGVSESTMKRGLENLEKKKAIRVKICHRTRGGSRLQLPNEYILFDLDQRPTHKL